MTSHLFILGRTPQLALQELKTFFPDMALLCLDVAKSDAAFAVPPATVLSRLGGTVKIAEVLDSVKEITAETLAPLFDTTHGRFSFGVSVYGGAQPVSRQGLEDIKTLLTGRGASVRFVESRGGQSLSSVVVAKNDLQELVVVKTGEAYVVGRTRAVQPFEAWGARDFGRPHADPKSGMLPPKVSRMAVNVADQKRDISTLLAQKTLLDPFCGMGTILGEALVMGWNVVGADNDATAVERARGNLRWLMEHHEAEGVTSRLHVSDAVHISESVDAATIDAIVTEPYMGPTEIAVGRKSAEELKNIVKGLEKLYIGCLRDWLRVLKPRGVVMMALPVYTLGGRTYFVKKVIDMCETLGYTISTGPIEYGRPQAVVKRSFYLFQKI